MSITPSLMRIVAGKYRATRIDAPKGLTTRPTSDRVRQALFNALEHGAPGVDFTGVPSICRLGVHGLEALSRGVRLRLFVEDSAEARAAIPMSRRWHLTGATKIWRRDATKLGEAGTDAALRPRC